MRGNFALRSGEGGKPYNLIRRGEMVEIQGMGKVPLNLLEGIALGDRVLVNGREFFVTPFCRETYIEGCRRGPQDLCEKDISAILSFLSNSEYPEILEAGGGNGSLTYALCKAFPGRRIRTYEIREDHYSVLKENISPFGFENLEMVNGDVSSYPGEVGALFLDLVSPEKVLGSIRGLIPGATVVVFVPNLSQVRELKEALRGGFWDFEAIEVTHRGHFVDGDVLKPKNTFFTGYLVKFIKKNVRQVEVQEEREEEVNPPYDEGGGFDQRGDDLGS